jgi:hypothetical protein
VQNISREPKQRNNPATGEAFTNKLESAPSVPHFENVGNLHLSGRFLVTWIGERILEGTPIKRK